MTDLEELLTTEWDVDSCQCAESQIDRSCQPATWRDLWLLSGCGGCEL